MSWPGIYNPHHTEEDKLISVLLYCLGGAQLTKFAHCTLHLPSLSTAQCQICISLSSLPVFPSKGKIHGNIESTHICSANKTAVTGQVPMTDKIKLEENLQWDPASNCILSLCWEHSHGHTHQFNKIQVAEVICDDLENGWIHLASEVRSLFHSRMKTE